MKKIIIALTSLIAVSVSAQDLNFDGKKYQIETLYEGDDVVWGFDFLAADKADEILLTLRDGKIIYLDLNTKKSHEVKGAPAVAARSQGGLLDLYRDHKNEVIYLTYSRPDAKGASTALMKGKLSADKKTFSGETIFVSNAHTKSNIHYGSRIAIGSDGLIFMSVGDRDERKRAQDLTYHNGKVLRLTTEGKAAPGNPFIGTEKAMPEIWSYGHRNPQGLIIDQKGNLLELEFGPRGGDELNLIKAGLNYGWPVVTYGSEYWGPKIGVNSKAGMEGPIHHWVPSISPSGMMQYSGKVFTSMKGNLFLANLAGSHLRRLTLNDSYKVIKEEKYLEHLEDRFRQVKEGPDGLIYLSTDSGKILRLKAL